MYLTVQGPGNAPVATLIPGPNRVVKEKSLPEKETMMENKEERSTGSSTSQDTDQMANLLVGGGILGALYLLIRKNRNIFSWIVPVGMMAAGIDLLMKDRQERIQQTGDQIMSQLDDLDPVARAQVVKYLAEQEKERLSK